MDTVIEEKRSKPRRGETDRREGERRAAEDRRREVVEVPVERRSFARRFV